MQKEEERESNIPNPFLNPVGFWQSYLLTWTEVSRGYYENATKAYEHWLKSIWDPWLRTTSSDKKERTKVE